VASVSCIYGLGSPEEYEKVNLKIEAESKINRAEFLRKLIYIHYERTNADLTPGTFRAIGNIIEIMPVSEKQVYRLEVVGDQIKSIQLDTNFRFPAWYINSDGIQMGWKNLWGVMKYYAFYAGPVSFLIMLLVAFFSFSNKFRSFLSRELNGAFTISIYFLISLFLLITEVLPRIGNIAYLPDRAWTFLGILFIFLLFQVLMYLETESLLKAWVKNSIYISFFCAFTISIIGSIYVVNSIKYTLPEYQLKSFEWIQNNLESDRVIFLKQSNHLYSILIGVLALEILL
jgi:hypothetical protein